MTSLDENDRVAESYVVDTVNSVKYTLCILIPLNLIPALPLQLIKFLAALIIWV